MSVIVCPECQGVGRVVLGRMTSVAQVVDCPLCQGSGWTETKPAPGLAEGPSSFVPDEQDGGT